MGTGESLSHSLRSFPSAEKNMVHYLLVLREDVGRRRRGSREQGVVREQG